MLYNGRKFDIRCYALITCINNRIKAYFYREGYLRTSCVLYNMSNITDRFIHLTNDAVQKHSEDYGAFEDSNKLSYKDFQDYLNRTSNTPLDFKQDVYPEIRSIVKDTISATYFKLNPSRRVHMFEVLGYDFMLDEFARPWLIEVNTNPCLELSGGYLKKLIPKMLKESLDIVIGKVFQQDKCDVKTTGFELIFAEHKH
jgi:hypothetical protein